MRLLNIHRPSAIYAATSLGSTSINAVFNFYYVKIYLEKFHVSEEWFHVSQIVFMIWNAINDPLFGYVQDNFNFSWVKSRRHSILYGAPFYALAFLVPWFPWGDYSKPTTLCGIQLMFSLCFYDTMFTFVLLAACSLFTELSQLQADRIRLIRYSQTASLIGSTSVFFSGLVSKNLENYGLFLCSCIILAFFSLVCFTITGRNSYTPYDLENISKEKETSESLNNDNNEKKQSIWQQMRQIIANRNFISFVLVNLCQIYQSTYLANFAAIICDKFISSEVLSSQMRSVFYGSLFTIPQFLLIIGSPILSRVGYYRVIRGSFILKVMSGTCLYLVGPKWWMLMIFFIVECSAEKSVFSIFSLCLSDIIDEDKQNFGRKFPLSSMVYGTNALITKPGHSLAPMITVAILNQYGYDNFKTATVSDVANTVQYQSLLHGMFLVTCTTPIIVGMLQMIFWSFYKIRNSHITVVKYVES